MWENTLIPRKGIEVEEEDELNSVAVEITDMEMTMLQLSLNMLMARIQDDIDEVENNDDDSINLLCGMFDKQFAVMSVWRKILVGAGVPEGIISAMLSRDMQEGEDS